MGIKRFLAEGFAFALLLLCINGPSLSETIAYHHADASLFESIRNGEDEMRYLDKIREAAEGHWSMSNPILKEYRDRYFSPSGFVEWIPAMMMRAFSWDLATVLLFTDILCSGIIILLLRLWLLHVLRHRTLTWFCLFLFFSTSYGGALTGILRDVTPKFTEPLFLLYLLLLALPSRDRPAQRTLRGTIIGMMVYTYPYHWTLCLLTEASFLMYEIFLQIRLKTTMRTIVEFTIRHGCFSFLPFFILATPITLAMRSMIAHPEFSDFYSRYHIVYTHLPAAPSLQVTVLLALLLGLWAMLNFPKKCRSDQYLPVLMPLAGSMLLLNMNVITGQDPELLGHLRQVILPILTIVYVLLYRTLVPLKFLNLTAATFCVGIMLFATHNTTEKALQLHRDHSIWGQSSEIAVIYWLKDSLPKGSIIAAPRIIAEQIPILTSHYVLFSAAAHFFFVPAEELTDRYLAWVGLYPDEKESTNSGSSILFGNHPGAQWSKERTIARLLGKPFTKSMADYIPRQDLRRIIEEEQAEKPNPKTTEARLKRYGVHAVVLRRSQDRSGIPTNMTVRARIGTYDIWAIRQDNRRE